MAPTGYAQGLRLSGGPAGDGHALPARDSDSNVQGYSNTYGPSPDDGYYHPSTYRAGEKGQKPADDGSYPPKQTGTTRQVASAGTAEQGTWGSQQSQGYQQGQQASGSQRYGSQNTGSQSTGYQSAGSQYSGLQSTGPQNTGSQSSSYNSSDYQKSNAQNGAHQQSQQGTPSNGSYQSGQGAAQQDQTYSGTANTNAQQENSWSQKAQDPHSQQSQQNPWNATEGQSNSHSEAAQSSHQQQTNVGDWSNAQTVAQNESQHNETPNLVNHHVSPAETLPIADQPTNTLPATPVTISPTFSLTTSATSESTQTTLPTTPPTSSATSSPTAEAANSSDDGLSYHKATGALAGVLGVALVAGFLIFFLSRRKKQQKGETKKSKMVRDAFRQFYISTKQRTSQFYASFLGTAVGTGASAMGAVRRSLAMAKFHNRHSKQESEKEQAQHHPSHDSHIGQDQFYLRGNSGEASSGHESDRQDSIAEEKAAINESTPTLVVSPSENVGREQTPTVRRVVSGRPQMENSDSVEPKSGIPSSAQESEPEPSEKAPEVKPSTSPPPDNGGTRPGHNLLAITSMVPSTSGVYRVDIEFQHKKVGQLDLREGQHIIIRQSFDDGWVSFLFPLYASISLRRQVLCSPADGGQEGLAPRACLSPWPIKNASTNSSHNLSDGSRTPESPSTPGTPRFYSHFFSARSVTQ